MEDVAEFLLDLRTGGDGISRRARRVQRRFQQAATVVVTTADPTPAQEAVRFLRELPEATTAPVAVVFNQAILTGWSKATRQAGPTGPIGKAFHANLQN